MKCVLAFILRFPSGDKMDHKLSISVESQLPFTQCLNSVRHLITRSGFHILAEVPFHREFEQRLGLKFRQYIVLIVWNPFQGYEAVLSDAQAGVLMPFHFVIAESEKATVVAATNLALLARTAGSVGLQFLASKVNQQVHELFFELQKLDSNSAKVPLFCGGEE